MHGIVDWPTKAPEACLDKALFRRKLLQPLPRIAGYPSVEGEVESQPLRISWADRPPLLPKDSSKLKTAKAETAASFSSRPPSRPGTANRARPPLSVVAFPARLQLRGPSEAPGPLGPYAAKGDALVIPIATQHAVQDLITACSHGLSQLRDGSCLTAWVVLDGFSEGKCHLLEPLAARRLDRTLAVEPIELVAERQGAIANGGSDSQPLRFGEGLRLRAAGCSGLYLGHSGAQGGLCWIQAATNMSASSGPKCTRFAAHGGELGAALMLGQPVSLRRVLSPPVSDSESDEEEEDPYSDSEFPARSSNVTATRLAGNQVNTSSETGLTSSLLPEARHYAEEGLFSRAADQVDSSVPVTFLPLFPETLA